MSKLPIKYGKRNTARIFVDANTILSGLVFEGNEGRLLDLGLANLCDLVSSEYVLEEVKRALSKTEFGLSLDQQAFLVSFLHQCVRIYPSPSKKEVEMRASSLEDQKDIPILASYETLGCDLLVTGDKEMLRKVKGAKRNSELLKSILEEGL